LTGTLTDVPGLTVGHWTDLDAATGCTVVLCEPAAVAAVDVRGAAPATRETDLLRPENTVRRIDAVLLAGGSAFGLAAADGVMRFLEERGRGFRTSSGPVPIVVAAALYDLGLGGRENRPGSNEGHAACLAASKHPVPCGSVGAGTGATVGKLRGIGAAMKGGLGSASARLASGGIVAALVAVNAFGDVVEPDTGRQIAGPRGADELLLNTSELIETLGERRPFGQSTTLGVIATDVDLDRVALLRVAQMAHDGLARSIRPAHTGYDGDAVFALSTAQRPSLDASIIGSRAADLLAMAVVCAITSATPLHGLPSARNEAL
jgi:L-aminopeptidase/D-esterase-like protein